MNWYLKEVEADIETIEELAVKNVLVEKVIDRLVQHVSPCESVCHNQYNVLLGSGYLSKYTV